MIDDLAARAPAGEGDAAFVRQVEDVLGQGYAHALALDAQRRRLDGEMERLSRSTAGIDTLGCVHTLAARTRKVDARAQDLRARLAVLRERYVALGGTRVSG